MHTLPVGLYNELPRSYLLVQDPRQGKKKVVYICGSNEEKDATHYINIYGKHASLCSMSPASRVSSTLHWVKHTNMVGICNRPMSHFSAGLAATLKQSRMTRFSEKPELTYNL